MCELLCGRCAGFWQKYLSFKSSTSIRKLTQNFIQIDKNSVALFNTLT